MERGRALRWVAGERSLWRESLPSVDRPFAPAEPSKEAHDSIVPVLQCRRTRRPRRREPTSALGPAGHHYQAWMSKRPRLLRRATDGVAPRNDGGARQRSGCWVRRQAGVIIIREP